jgi:hypothetical protein
MKKVIMLWMFFILVLSCSKAPDNIIHKQETVKGDWVLKNGTRVQEDVVNYSIAPTFGQSLDIATRRKDHKSKIGLSICLGTIFVFLMIGLFLHLNYIPKWYEENAILQGAVNLLLVGFCIHFAISDAVGIKNNNDKWVTKTKYDSVLKADGNIKAIWDEFEKNHQIVDGPY